MRSTIRSFLDDDCPRMAAALAYYTVFSLPALLVLVVLVAGAFLGPETIREALLDQMRTLIGRDAALQVREILMNVERPGSGGPLAIVLSVAGLLFAATGAFAQLQGALNRAWEVEPDPDRGIRNFIAKRLLSFAMILGVALLLILSLGAQAVFAWFGDVVAASLPAPLSGLFLQVASVALSLLVATGLFGLLFQVLPDARVHWTDAWKGAGATAVLFLLGNLVLGFYLSRSAAGSAFGAAGSLALILAWIYYSSMIIFFGAELTQVIARRRGAAIRPAAGAVRVEQVKRTIREEDTR